MQSPSAESLVPVDAKIWSISALNSATGALLEERFPSLWITGEISNLARPGSGHLYFSLKDATAEVRCAMFRGSNRTLKFQPANGDQVIVRARVTVYAPRGSYQLIVEHMEPAGSGILRRKLEELKTRLDREGLFAPERKRPLPPLPARIGIVTSPTGAAVHDVLQILARRFPAIPVVIYPVQVQGDRAKHEIAAALDTAARRNECDVLILGRGGGSLEDLWAFNEEIVVRAIFACPIPIVSAVGHEVDFTLADLVADLRAPTPSGAAELVVPDAAQWLQTLRSIDQRLAGGMGRHLAQCSQRLEQLSGRIRRRHPGWILQQHAQRLDELTRRIGTSLLRRIDLDHMRLANLRSRLTHANPLRGIERRRQQLERAGLRLDTAMRERLAAARNRLAVAAAGLQAVSPLKTLERGYSIVTDADSGAVISGSAALHTGQHISGRLAEGGFDAVVSKVR
ncbi:MAG: exodeoxyribonuclease VII large subunit [Gammaproteobacteria bacterium]|nr:MAG: exodeoxyribonuclease VII large subunit [Gammaproteobacteria bacterium]